MIDELVAGFRFPIGAPVCKSAEGAVTKSVEADVKPVENSKNPNGEFVVILSKDNLDRDAENLWADEWMHPLPSKIHMDSDHAFAQGLSVPYTVGSGVPSINENGDLIVRGSYAGTPHGQLVRQLVNEGHVWGASVSYQTRVFDDGRIERELLNGTFCGVPANPKAVVLSSKSARSIDNKSGDIDGEDLIKAIHDVAVALGATCSRCGAKQSRRKRTKTVDRGAGRAAVMARAHARARRFALTQNINAVMAEIGSPSKVSAWGAGGNSPS